METVPIAIDSWERYLMMTLREGKVLFYANLEVRPHDAAVAARFRREYDRLKEELTPPPKRWFETLMDGPGPSTYYYFEWQKLYERGDKDAVALDQLIAPFTGDERALLKEMDWRIDGLAAIVNAREWRTDPEKMKQAVEMVKEKRRRGQSVGMSDEAAQTGRAYMNLRDSDTNLGDMGYWSGQL